MAALEFAQNVNQVTVGIGILKLVLESTIFGDIKVLQSANHQVENLAFQSKRILHSPK